MKLVVIGFGQCGGRIADEFARLNIKARTLRGIDIIAGPFAANTDVADLSGLSFIKSDFKHRILIGGRKAGGHGVGKINELGAEFAREDADKIINAISNDPRFSETDAFLLTAGAGGGTGSGSIPVITQQLKERYIDKPVYNLIVLPFEHEEATEDRSVYNSATCLKSSYLVADAIFLVDNQRFARKDTSISANLAQINTMIVEPFFNILCAGEEKKPRYIGAKMLDAGDIIQTLSGWTTIGYGKLRTSRLNLSFSTMELSLRNTVNFRHKVVGTQKGLQALEKAVSDLSIKCNPVDSGRALYLISGPASEINVDLIKEVGTYIKKLAPEAIIRNGDYPREKGILNVTLILSDISDIAKVRSYFTKVIKIIANSNKRREGIVSKRRDMEVTIKDIPSLI